MQKIKTTKIKEVEASLKLLATVPIERHTVFYKTGAGDYAEHDQFLGVKTPVLRQLAKKFSDLTINEIQTLLSSKYNEERLLALFILINRYQKSNILDRNNIFNFYLTNLQNVNNWNLVDSSAHYIIGAHLLDQAQDKDLLLKLAKSNILWERRIAIVATWYFIRNNKLEWTYKIAIILLSDNHDLIHKSVGWMLREAGKKNQEQLKVFLDKYSDLMPRTMLRYSIEKLTKSDKKKYLAK